MSSSRLVALAAVLGLSVLGVAPAAVAAPGNADFGVAHMPVCPGPPSQVHCHSDVVTDRSGKPMASSSPTGLSPTRIRNAYGWGSIGSGAGQTIAIVDAYDDPTAVNDFAVFSNTYGLTGGSLTKVNQRGVHGSYPTANAGWALEISLDIEWAHAIAPQAAILLVEADSNSFANLMIAEDYARAHAGYVSNSWGGSEFAGEATYDSHFSGANVFVSAGDSGLPAEYPSASPKVISVGGTTLHFDANKNFTSETGWSNGGGGCSTQETAIPEQSTFPTYGQVNCAGRRATPDVALDADPTSGVSVYDSTRYQGQKGWFSVGGTSASSPMWAGRAAASAASITPASIYTGTVSFRDITSGNNGAPCLSGYDLVTGRGSWTGSA